MDLVPRCILLLGALAFVSAQECPRVVYAVPKPLSIVTGFRYLPDSLVQEPDFYRSPLLVSQNSMIFANHDQGSVSEKIVVFRAIQVHVFYTLYKVDKYDVTYRGGQTWETPRYVPYPPSNCFPLASRVISSPFRMHVVLFGFQAKDCHDRLLVYNGSNQRIMSSTGGDLVPREFAPAAASIEGHNGTFHILSFGGSLCSNPGIPVCMQFSSDLWKLSIDLETSAKPEWAKININSANAHEPGPRAGGHLFAAGGWLLLFGGISSNVRSLHVNCDFWLFDMERNEWAGISSNLRCTGPRVINDTSRLLEVIPLTKAAYVESASMLLVSEVDPASRNVYLTMCSVRVHQRHVECSGKRLIAQNSDRLAQWYTLVAGLDTFFLVRQDHQGSYEVEATVDIANLSVVPHSSVIPLVNEDDKPVFPGFQGCSGSAMIPLFSGTYRFFGGDCRFRSLNVKIGQLISQPALEIWTVVTNPAIPKQASTYRFVYPRPGPSLPARTGHTVTRVSVSHAVLYGGVEHSPTEQRLADPSPWCYKLYDETWSEASSTNGIRFPPPRQGHVAFNSSFGFAVQGGMSAMRAPSPEAILGDLWIFAWDDVGKCRGKWLELTKMVRGGTLPCRSGQSLTPYGNGVILFGGQYGTCSQATDQTPHAELDYHLTALQIHSQQMAEVSLIRLADPVRRRFFHTLHWYTSTDLLLLGGFQGSKATLQFAEDALLIQVAMDGDTVNASIIPYFKFEIVYHTVAGDFVFSGLQPPQKGQARTTYLSLENGRNCPIGYYRTVNDSCQPCDEGYYSPSIDSQCMKCGRLLTTHKKGSSNCTAYNPCYENFCNSHGTCFIRKDSQAYCECNFGYLSDDNCLLPSVYLYLLAAVVFSSLVTLLSTYLYKFIRKMRELKLTERDLQESHRDLQHSQRKLDNVNRGASIRWSDLIIERELEDPGRFSKLFLAKMTDVTVVVKQYPVHFSRSRGEVSESPYDVFVREAETLRSLRHPNIVTFLGAGQDPGSGKPFLVMEYLRRGSLYNVLHDSTITIDHSDSIRFALDAAKGMTYLHGLDSPRIHRDIKSANLLVSEKWVVKVADLETARLLTTAVASNADSTARREEQVGTATDEPGAEITPLFNDSSRTTTSLSMDVFTYRGMTCGAGTDRWRSPESITKNLYTEKGDVYSYGVVLWEICSRRLPYEELTCSEDIHEEIKNEKKPIFPPHVRYDYRHLAERCLKTEAEERPSFVGISAELQQQQQQHTAQMR